MKGLEPDERARTLLAPVAPLIAYAMEQLPEVEPLRVRVGSCEGISAREGSVLTLSEGLEGPHTQHPLEPRTSMPPLDRWRRAAGCVLEAVATLGLSAHVHRDPRPDWRWRGAAIHVVDRLAPDLNLASPDIALAVNTGHPGAHPRAGVAVLRAWQAAGHDPMQRVQYLLGGGVMSAQEWLNIGRWVLDPAGASAALPVVCTRPPAVEPPARLPAWSWRQVHWSPGAQGGQLLLEGEGAVEESWAAADETLHTLVAATGSGCEITSGAGGPVGEWEVASAQGFGQVMGARGVSFTFKANGALEVVLADAFVGPLAAVAVAGEVGTSGVVHGRWWVCGPQAIAFGGIASHSLTMHGRRSERFMVPAKGFGLGEWLEALEEGPWAWEAANARLVMRGQMMGGMVEVRLRRVR